MEWLYLAIVPIVIVLWLTTRGRSLDKIFADQHFVEVAQGLVQIKAAAQERVEVSEDRVPPEDDDPRALLTSARLMVFYTIIQDTGEFTHHYSVSLAGTYTAGAIGETFSLYIAYLLGVSPQQLSIARSEGTVFHTEFVLDPAEQELFIHRQLEVPALSAIPGIKATLSQWRDNIEVQGIMTS